MVEHTKKEEFQKGLKKVRSLSRSNVENQRVLYDEDENKKLKQQVIRDSQRSSIHDHSKSSKHACSTKVFIDRFSSKIYDNVDSKRTAIMMEERRQELARQHKKAMYNEYLLQRRSEREHVDAQMLEQKLIEEALNNPEIQIDMHNLVESNLESMMKDSEAY